MFIHWHSTAKTRVRGRYFSWFWKLKHSFLGASSTKMRRYMNVEIHHLNNTELLKERARHTEHMQSCIYPRHIMLWGDDMPSFPSLLLIFSLYLGSLTLETIYFSSANHDSPFFSLVVSFCTKLLMCFSLSGQCTRAVRGANPCCLYWHWPYPSAAGGCWAGIFRVLLRRSRLQTDWDMFGGSAMFATRGGEEQKLSVEIYWDWRPHDFLLNLKIPSIIFLNQLCSLSLFTSILQGQRYFFLSVCQWHQSVICHRRESYSQGTSF